MKQSLFKILLLLFLPTLGFSQSGDGYVNYTSYKTQCGNGCVFSRTVDGTSVQVYQHISNTAEFDAAMTIQSNSNAVYVMNSGEALAKSNKGFGTSISSTIGGRPTGQTQGEYYIVDYTGWFYASSTGNYKFHTWSDDAHEFYLDLDGDDPLIPKLKELEKVGGIDLNILPEGYYPGIEESCRYLYDKLNPMIKEKTNNRVEITRVEVWEHENSTALKSSPLIW